MAAQKALRVLLAVDGSPFSEAAVKLAVVMSWPNGTVIRVLAVVAESGTSLGLSPEAQTVVAEAMTVIRRKEHDAADRLAREVADRLREAPPVAPGATVSVETEVCEGRPAEVILERADALATDLVMIGAKGLSAPHEYRLGSTAHKLAHYASCSVLIARPPQYVQPTNVLLAVDGSPESARAVDFVCNLTMPNWAEVTAVSVAEITIGVPAGEHKVVADVPEVVRRTLLDAAETYVDDATNRLRPTGVEINRAVYAGQPAVEIIGAAEEHDADLIVLGARGQTRAEPFHLGGVAQKVIKYAPCSVLIVR